MTIEKKEGLVVFHLEERIDSGNVAAFEKDVMDAAGENKDSGLLVDAKALSYISSAGLRVLLRLQKKQRTPLKIVNVSRDVYDIFETTGFTEVFEVHKAYREMSVEGLDVIGKGFFGTVYRVDADKIVKVYKGEDSIPMIEKEKRAAKKAFLSGIPTAISYDIVKVGDDYGSVFELLNAKTINELILENAVPMEEIVSEYTKLLWHVHHTTLEPGTFPSCKDQYSGYLEAIKIHLSENQHRALAKLILDVPDQNTVVHGDVQMKNIMLVDGEAMLIDLETIALGNPIFEFAGLFMAYKAFPEDEPDNSMVFFGVSQSVLDELWDRLLAAYFQFRDEEEKQKILDRILLMGYVRFLFLLETTELKNNAFGEARIRHTKEHIAELLTRVGSLAVSAPDEI